MGTDNKLGKMKVLWVSLVKFPPLCEYLHEDTPSYCGWMYASAKALLKTNENISLGVVIPDVKYQHYKIDGISYYLVPVAGLSKYTKKTVAFCKTTVADFKPDIIHIHGTEFSLGLAMAKANKKIPIVASIQGLTGPYARYADGFLSFKDKLFNITLRDVFRMDTLFQVQKRYRQRGENEEQLIRSLSNIIGRTYWDKSHVKAINPSIKYYFCNETLRDIFYDENKWSLDKCTKHTIFVSNSNVPLKGAHIVLKAIPIILQYYPDVKVKFVGNNIFDSNLKRKLRFTGYNLFLKRLIKKLDVRKNVEFLGSLSEDQMKQAFLSAHVYVLPSAIENSPNSLCEAQILGVPSVASYCGGVPDLIEDGKTGFCYRFSEYEMLASKVIELFKSNNLASLSEKEQQVALERHNPHRNAEQLMITYQSIISF